MYFNRFESFTSLFFVDFFFTFSCGLNRFCGGRFNENMVVEMEFASGCIAEEISGVFETKKKVS